MKPSELRRFIASNDGVVDQYFDSDKKNDLIQIVLTDTSIPFDIQRTMNMLLAVYLAKDILHLLEDYLE